MHLSLSPGSEPNPHALAAFSKTSDSHAIVASQDIVDTQGIKLWARGRRVSSSLQQRLLERRLRQPMEVCLAAEDGVTAVSLLARLRELIGSDHPLMPAIRPWEDVLLAQFKKIPLHSVAQLLLTTMAATRPAALTHAVEAMALSGAMLASRDASDSEIRMGLLGGLLHDVGEIYLHPHCLDYTQPLDVTGHKQLIAHPRIGRLVLDVLTDYPKTITCAIAEHHERLDHSGYPARLGASDISPLGRVLSVAEAVLGSVSSTHAPLSRASFALRVIPGEFDPELAAFFNDAACSVHEAFDDESLPSASTLAAQLTEIDHQLDAARELAMQLEEQRRTSRITSIVDDALQRLAQLRVAWNDLGLWGVTDDDTATPIERIELEFAESELRQRLRAFHRECLLLSEGLSEAEKMRLKPLWHGLLDPTKPVAIN